MAVHACFGQYNIKLFLIAGSCGFYSILQAHNLFSLSDHHHAKKKIYVF